MPNHTPLLKLKALDLHAIDLYGFFIRRIFTATENYRLLTPSTGAGRTCRRAVVPRIQSMGLGDSKWSGSLEGT